MNYWPLVLFIFCTSSCSIIKKKISVRVPSSFKNKTDCGYSFISLFKTGADSTSNDIILTPSANRKHVLINRNLNILLGQLEDALYDETGNSTKISRAVLARAMVWNLIETVGELKNNDLNSAPRKIFGRKYLGLELLGKDNMRSNGYFTSIKNFIEHYGLTPEGAFGIDESPEATTLFLENFIQRAGPLIEKLIDDSEKPRANISRLGASYSKELKQSFSSELKPFINREFILPNGEKTTPQQYYRDNFSPFVEEMTIIEQMPTNDLKDLLADAFQRRNRKMEDQPPKKTVRELINRMQSIQNEDKLPGNIEKMIQAIDEGRVIKAKIRYIKNFHDESSGRLHDDSYNIIAKQSFQDYIFERKSLEIVGYEKSSDGKIVNWISRDPMPNGEDYIISHQYFSRNFIDAFFISQKSKNLTVINSLEILKDGILDYKSRFGGYRQWKATKDNVDIAFNSNQTPLYIGITEMLIDIQKRISTPNISLYEIQKTLEIFRLINTESVRISSLVMKPGFHKTTIEVLEKIKNQLTVDSEMLDNIEELENILRYTTLNQRSFISISSEISKMFNVENGKFYLDLQKRLEEAPDISESQLLILKNSYESTNKLLTLVTNKQFVETIEYDLIQKEAAINAIYEIRMSLISNNGVLTANSLDRIKDILSKLLKY